MRVVLTRAFDKTTSSTMAARYASVVASVINTIAIQIMNYLFQYVARFFNTWENHRTDVEHYNNLILKLISFNFCNYNIPLVYNAFFQRHLEGCPRGDGDIEPGKGTCYSALEMNLGIIFLTKWFSGLCMDLLIPYLEKKYKRHKHPELTDERDGKHEAELQFDSHRRMASRTRSRTCRTLPCGLGLLRCLLPHYLAYPLWPGSLIN